MIGSAEVETVVRLYRCQLRWRVSASGVFSAGRAREGGRNRGGCA